MKKLTWVLCLTLGIFMLAGCGNNDGNNDNNQNMNNMETVALYFGERDKHELVKEDRDIPAVNGEDQEAKAKAVLEELIKGPTESRCSPVLPTETKVNSVKVTNGLATVDFSKDLTDNYDDQMMESAITVDAIVATLTRLNGIDRVKLTVDGSPLKIGNTEIRDELTVDTALQQQIDTLDGKTRTNGDNDVMDDGRDVVDDMVEGGRDIVDDMADTGRDIVEDGKDMIEDGADAVRDTLNPNDNRNRNNVNNNTNNTNR